MHRRALDEIISKGKVMSLVMKEVRFDGRNLRLSPDTPITSGLNQVTVIVGKNSVGKSRLLSAITKVFQAVDTERLTLRRERGPNGRPKAQIDDFYLSYQKDEWVNRLSIEGGRINAEITGKLTLPAKVIATSTSPFDKFPVDGRRGIEINSPNSIYSYLGTRTVFGQYSSLAQLTRVVDSLTSASNKTAAELTKLRHVFAFLGYTPIFKVEFRFRFNPRNMEKRLSMSKLEALEYLEHYSSFGFQHRLRTMSEDQIEELLIAVKSVVHEFSDARTPEFVVDLNSGNFLTGSQDLYQRTKVLRYLGLMQLTDFVLYHEQRQENSIKDASSGEQCVMLTILGIASEIKDGSLICIDEPEISLHPEWQEQFIDLVLKTFTDYRGCHFLIATHSPQIVSKLLAENCYILTMDDGNLHLSENYANRSADFQLTKIFRAPGFNNEYINRECVSFLTRVSKIGGIEEEDKARGNFLVGLLPLLDERDSVKQLLYIVKETLEKLSK